MPGENWERSLCFPIGSFSIGNDFIVASWCERPYRRWHLCSHRNQNSLRTFEFDLGRAAVQFVVNNKPNRQPPMKLTPAQFRDVLGISQETLRHWRKVLPIFSGRSGYAPIFRPGDLVAGAVIKMLKNSWGISVSAFADQSIAIGQICNDTPWSTLSDGALVIFLDDKACELVPADTPQSVDSAQLIVPLAPIVSAITGSLLQEGGDPQRPIYFPLTEVEPALRKRSAR